MGIWSDVASTKAYRSLVGETVRRERRWTAAGATPARELVRSTRLAIEAAVEATKLSELSMERVARRLREHVGHNVSGVS
jgi:hypothetical protein